MPYPHHGEESRHGINRSCRQVRDGKLLPLAIRGRRFPTPTTYYSASQAGPTSQSFMAFEPRRVMFLHLRDNAASRTFLASTPSPQPRTPIRASETVLEAIRAFAHEQLKMQGL